MTLLDSRLTSELIELLDYATPSELAEIEKLVADDSIDAETAPSHFHAGQLAVWEDSDSLDIVACAGHQGGKTEEDSYWLLREIQRTAKYCEELPGGERGRAAYIFCGPTLELLSAQAIPAFEELFVSKHNLGRLVKGNKPKFTFSEDGARRLCGKPYRIEIRFAYANDSSNLESVTALGGVWDEAGQKENKLGSYRAFGRRLTTARSIGERLGVPLGRRLFTTTPYEWGWFKDFVVDPAIRGDAGFSYHNWPSWFNPLVSEERCLAEREKMPLEEWEMMFLGKFTRPRGKVYDCFDYSKHVVRRPDGEVYPAEWPRMGGMDFGPNNAAALKIVGEREQWPNGKWGEMTGRFVVYAEYHPGEKRTPRAHMAGILDGEKGLGFWGGAHAEDDSRALYTELGMSVNKPLVSDVEAGIAVVYRLIKEGSLFVDAECEELINEFTTYAFELDDAGEPIQDVKRIQDKSKYHLLDALRYVAPCLVKRSMLSYRKVRDDSVASGWAIRA